MSIFGPETERALIAIWVGETGRGEEVRGREKWQNAMTRPECVRTHVCNCETWRVYPDRIACEENNHGKPRLVPLTLLLFLIITTITYITTNPLQFSPHFIHPLASSAQICIDSFTIRLLHLPCLPGLIMSGFSEWVCMKLSSKCGGDHSVSLWSRVSTDMQ